jgi:ribosome modulation factor
MNKTWLARNFITGKDEPLPKPDPNEPTEAWVQGWTASMNNEFKSSPYAESSQEHHDWLDGYKAAERD